MDDIVFQTRCKLLKRLFYIALTGVAVFIGGLIIYRNQDNFVCGIGVLFMIPLLLYAAFFALLHWKERYQGKVSEEWAIGFVVASLFVLPFYYIYHIIPDFKGVGIYRRT